MDRYLKALRLHIVIVIVTSCYIHFFLSNMIPKYPQNEEVLIEWGTNEKFCGLNLFGSGSSSPRSSRMAERAGRVLFFSISCLDGPVPEGFGVTNQIESILEIEFSMVWWKRIIAYYVYIYIQYRCIRSYMPYYRGSCPQTGIMNKLFHHFPRCPGSQVSAGHAPLLCELSRGCACRDATMTRGKGSAMRN